MPLSPLQEQYRDSGNFRKRAALVAKFGTNRYPWYRWVFDQLEFKTDSAVLELGCGPGTFWKHNLERTPPGARLVLSDFSAGMLRDCARNLGAGRARVSFCQLDAAQLPFRAARFDTVLANMMFYHVENRPAALLDIHRVLARDGVFCATTTGRGYMRDLRHTAYDILEVPSRRPSAERFGLENGADLLASVFAHVELRRYENALRVTEVRPLMDYFRSMAPFISPPADRWSVLHEYLAGIIGERGELLIPIDVGMLIARD